jgi:uncharacterized protein
VPRPNDRPSRVTPSKKDLAKGSSASRSPKKAPAEKGSSAAGRKGRITEAEGPPRAGLLSRLFPPRPAAVEVGDPEAQAESARTDDGVVEPGDGRRYGAGAILMVFLVAQVLATLAYAFVIPGSDYDPNAVTGLGGPVGQAVNQATTGQPVVLSQPIPLWLSTLLQLPLWGALIAGPIWFATKKGRGVVADLGLRMKAVDVPVGLAIGVASQLLMVPALYWLVFKAIGVQDVSAEARALTDRATDPLSVLLVFVIVGIGAPVAEEIYFRGMALPIFRRRLRARWAVFASAAFFAATHLQPLQFPALLIFGVVLGVLTVRAGRLGPAIWAHVGFNVVAAVTLLWNLSLF